MKIRVSYELDVDAGEGIGEEKGKDAIRKEVMRTGENINRDLKIALKHQGCRLEYVAVEWDIDREWLK